MRAEFALISAAFDLFPTLSGGNGNRFVLFNPGGTAFTSSVTTETSGRVGINGVATTYGLEVMQPTRAWMATRATATTGTDAVGGLVFQSWDGVSMTTGATISQSFGLQAVDPNNLRINNARNAPIIFGLNNVEVARLKLTGALAYLGLNTNNPAVMVHGVGTGSTARVRMESVGGAITEMTSSGAAGSIGTINNIPLLISTNSAERLRVASSGTPGEVHVSMGGASASAWGSAMQSVEFGTIGAVAGNTGAAYFSGNLYYDGTNWRTMTTAAGTLMYSSAGNTTFAIAPSAAAGGVSNPATAMLIAATTGNVTITAGLGINGKAAVADVARPANPTDLPTCITRITNLLDKLQSFGLYT